MDYKQLVADTLAPSLTDVLSAEDIYQKIERPKDTSKGDYAFPAFTLAKAMKKAPQQIAADLVARSTHLILKRLKLLVHT